MSNTHKGLYVNIFTTKMFKGCANGGVSEHYDELLIVGEGIPEIFSAREGEPVLKLEKGPMNTVRAKLLPEFAPEGKCAMSGGAFVSTTDSRFSEAIEKLLGHGFYGAIALHDRYE